MSSDLLILDTCIPERLAAETVRARAELRRSTLAIAHGVVGIAELFERNPALRRLAEVDELGLIVGSSLGELEVTCDFLKELALRETARPFLFQLSSHNSTLGFLAQYFNLRGPCLTISNQYQTAESSLEAATLLLQFTRCRAVVLFCFDFAVEGLVDHDLYKTNAGLAGADGVAIAVVTTVEKLPEIHPRATLSEFGFGVAVEVSAFDRQFHDSNTLGAIAHDLKTSSFGKKLIARPDSTLTSFRLEAYDGV